MASQEDLSEGKKRRVRVVKQKPQSQRKLKTVVVPGDISGLRNGPNDKVEVNKEQAPVITNSEVAPRPSTIVVERQHGVVETELAPGFELECTFCGALTAFATDNCPICGKRYDHGDGGLVSLFADMEFDCIPSAEMDCPSCGEKVTLENGRCPSCDEMVQSDGLADSGMKLEPVVHNDNVIYMHLDVESGEVNCLQRLPNRIGFERLTVKLDELDCQAGYKTASSA